jgi:hypothetical protein
MPVRHVQTQAATTAAVSWSIFVTDDFDVLRIDIVIGVAPTSAGSVTVKKDSVAGAAYDAVISTTDAQSETVLNITDLKGFVNGDKLLVEYANPDSRTITGTATVEIP